MSELLRSLNSAMPWFLLGLFLAAAFQLFLLAIRSRERRKMEVQLFELVARTRSLLDEISIADKEIYELSQRVEKISDVEIESQHSRISSRHREMLGTVHGFLAKLDGLETALLPNKANRARLELDNLRVRLDSLLQLHRAAIRHDGDERSRETSPSEN